MKPTREKIYVFGASGHAKVIVDSIEAEGRYIVAEIYDDNSALLGKELLGYRVVGGRDQIIKSNVLCGIVAIGDNSVRMEIASWLISHGKKLISVVHPSAVVARGVTIGNGSALMAGAIVNSDTVIGAGVILNTNASVDHDCKIGDGVHIAPGVTVCGSVNVGDKVFVGVGAKILPNIIIGANSVVGAGSTVVKNIDENVTVIGTPARKVYAK